MPARSAFVPKYCLHKPSGRAYVRIRGKVIYVGDYGTAESKAEYGRRVAELAINPTCVSVQPASAVTVVELIDAYWSFAQGYYIHAGKPTSTMEGIRRSLRDLRRPPTPKTAISGQLRGP